VPTSDWFSSQKNLENRSYEEKQMTAMNKIAAGASSDELTTAWYSNDWPTVEKRVRRLQMRIAKATREGRYGKVKALQWLMTHSHDAKILAVKRVVENRGGKTPG
jgi:RNA-directed DNA polymerase